jgi:hypothetical protein
MTAPRVYVNDPRQRQNGQKIATAWIGTAEEIRRICKGLRHVARLSAKARHRP